MARISPYLIRQVRMSVQTFSLTVQEIFRAFSALEHAIKPKLGAELKLKLAEAKAALRPKMELASDTERDLNWDYTVKIKKNVDGTETLVGKPLELNGQ